MRNEIEVAKEVIISYLKTLDSDIAKNELEKIENNDIETLFNHIKVLAETFEIAQKNIEKEN